MDNLKEQIARILTFPPVIDTDCDTGERSENITGTIEAILNLFQKRVEGLTVKNIEQHGYNNPSDVELGIFEQYWHTKKQLLEGLEG